MVSIKSFFSNLRWDIGL